MKRCLLSMIILLFFIDSPAQLSNSGEIGFELTNKIFEYNFETKLSCEPVIWKNEIFICDSSGTLTCIDTAGTEIWGHKIFGQVSQSPAVSEDFIAIPTEEGELITLRRSDGTQLQSLIFDEPAATNLISFEYTGSKQFMVPKQSNSNAAVIFGSSSGKIWCYDVETLEMIWEDNTSKKIIGNSLYYMDKKIFYLCDDGYVYCIDANAGWLIWKWKDEKSDAKNKPTEIYIGTNSIFVLTSENILHAIDSQLGSRQWENNSNKMTPPLGITGDKKNIIGFGKRDKLYIISALSGKNAKSFDFKIKDDFLSKEFPVFKNIILIAFKSGRVIAVDGKYNTKNMLDLNERLMALQFIHPNKFLISTRSGKIMMFNF